MSFLSAVPEDEAEGLVRDQYAAGRKALGYVPNYTKAFSARPGEMRNLDMAVGNEG